MLGQDLFSDDTILAIIFDVCVRYCYKYDNEISTVLNFIVSNFQ